MIERIRKIIENEQISVRAFEQKIKASNGLIRKAIANNTDIQSKWVTNIVENYPQYSADWLLTGSGSMLKDTESVPRAVKSDSNKEGIPLIPISAMAGFFTGEVNIMEYECERYIIPVFRDAEFLIQVKGMSMYPKYTAGDIVACKRLSLQDIFFQWNMVYVLDTAQGALIKRVRKGKDTEHILLVSENEAFEPIELCLEQINAVALVVGVIRLE
ncbi:MAG TPA: S24 family peptidase [Salinivirgaceae bacterium]|nr:S24 family peptidase [Salinivirgaceae bacterium]